jgi:four helix bundle protein
MRSFGDTDLASRITVVLMRDHASLIAWQTAREIAVDVARLARLHWKPSCAAMFGQLTRASLSVRLNIAEGYAFTNTPTFRRHLDIAYGSAVETGELLEHAKAAELLPGTDLDPLIERSKRCQRLTYGLLLHVKRTKHVRAKLPPEPPVSGP